MSKSVLERLTVQLADEPREKLIEIVYLVERQRDSYMDMAESYSKALHEIRSALGLSDSDEHEAVIAVIKRLSGRERQH